MLLQANQLLATATLRQRRPRTIYCDHNRYEHPQEIVPKTQRISACKLNIMPHKLAHDQPPPLMQISRTTTTLVPWQCLWKMISLHITVLGIIVLVTRIPRLGCNFGLKMEDSSHGALGRLAPTPTATRADHSGKLNSKQDLHDLHERKISFHWGLIL